MDDETRHELQSIKRRIAVLAGCIRTLQDLVRQQNDTIQVIEDQMSRS